MDFLDAVFPERALDRAFPASSAGYRRTGLARSGLGLSVGYLLAPGRPVNVVTVFTYRRENSLEQEFSAIRSATPAVEGREVLADGALTLAASGRRFPAMMKCEAFTAVFHGCRQPLVFETYLLDCGARFTAIRSTFPCAERALVAARFRDLVSSLGLG